MARRPNYGAEKRSKELGRQRKQEEKEEKKRARREAALAGDSTGAGLEGAEMARTGADDEDGGGDDGGE
ncbi:hypothetical protein [Longimicrobium sp.]|uniref:hypothetical protein n=1 Tax=Longimicrobium sp. TaxID=2029185 RepID=UPI002B81B8DB|nr:hypothetical protein [Longimicrobium sp.]HSU12518.1 hypothetical protein [Longimicrobium sp.]